MGSGGYILYSIYAQSGTVNIYGGNISAGTTENVGGFNTLGIWAHGSGTTITIAGSGFNFPYGPIGPTSGTLVGTLLDGSPINLTFSRPDAGKIILVPEPSGAMLGAMSFLCVLSLIRRSTHGSAPR